MKIPRSTTAAACWLAALLFLPLAAASLRAQMTNPASGTLNPASANTLSWVGTATGGAAADEGTAVDGVTRDYFMLTVAPGDYTNKVIPIRITWPVGAVDYDLVIHKDTVDGPIVTNSGNGAPSTEEAAIINPNNDGTGVFFINVVYFAAPPGVVEASRYTGTARVQTASDVRQATYVKGGITFSPNTPCLAPTSGQAGEPSSRCDFLGNYYIAGIRGVPAGIDLWYFDLRPGSPTYDPLMRNPLYRGQPDAPTANLQMGSVGLEGGGLGGGDVDLAVGFGNYTGPDATGTPTPALAFTSLLAANLPSARSLNLGATFTQNPAGNAAGGVPVNDRQWMEFAGPNTVFLLYRNFGAGVGFVSRSTDGGLTYTGGSTVVGTIPQTGTIDVDQFDGTVYVSGNDGTVRVGLAPDTDVPPDGQPNVGALPLTFTTSQAAPAGGGVDNIFFVTKVADDKRVGNVATGALNGPGTLYSCWSDGRNIFLTHSNDKGGSWATPVRVNDGRETNVCLLPWMETGPVPGSVVVAWFGTPNEANNDNSQWRVFVAQSFNANTNLPTFRQVQASDHIIHASNISLSGLAVGGETPNRNLIDYFQVVFDPLGAAIIGYTDDHNDLQGHTFVARQITGPSINGTGNVLTPVEGSGLAAAIAANKAGTLPGTDAPLLQYPGPNGEQVLDFAQDQDTGLLAVTPTNGPSDIVSIRYTFQDSNAGPQISATLKVSDLSVVPPNAQWRMMFAANSPESTLNASGQYTNGASDDGAQFYLQAVTGANPNQRTYTYGRVQRNFDGSLTYRQVGTARRGFINQANNTIVVTVTSQQLNSAALPMDANGPALAAPNPPVAFGSVLTGLRGTAFSGSGGVTFSDATRGGTQFSITNPF